MKVSGTGGLSQSSGARPAKGGGGGGDGFRIAGPSAPAAAAQVASAGGVSGVMGVEALLALQDVGTPTERKRRSVKRAGQLLDSLDELKVALLGGELSTTQMERLARTIREQREATDDPKLEAVLDEIETRAAVELAKLEASRKRA
ncbi:MAG: flagellar assembly protein FliX [Phenylobacterium zucineum]|nr:MAG: flagellar assembly protein FliX [Phenylobacterium zucineum]